MTRTPPKMIDFSNFSLVREASDPVRKGPPLWNSGISDELHFFLQSEITLWGKKRTAHFQTYNWEKSSSMRLYVYVHSAEIYAPLSHHSPPVLIGLTNLVSPGTSPPLFNIVLIWAYHPKKAYLRNVWAVWGQICHMDACKNAQLPTNFRSSPRCWWWHICSCGTQQCRLDKRNWK